MLKIDSMTMHFSGTSIVADEVVATFTASYHGGPELFLNMNATNINLFTANTATVMADFQDFMKEVTEAAAGENIVPIINTSVAE